MIEAVGETLRRAARLMRERAKLVPPPPWYPATHDVATHDGLDVIASSGLTVRAQYVASMHPGVALALADWLDSSAAMYDSYSEMTIAVLSGAMGTDPDPALKVARAYLRPEDAGLT